MTAVRIEPKSWNDWRFMALGEFFRSRCPDALDARDLAQMKFLRLVDRLTEDFDPALADPYTIHVIAVEHIGGTGFSQALIECHLAEPAEPGRIRIKGAVGRVEWQHERRMAGRAGGSASWAPGGGRRSAKVQQTVSKQSAKVQQTVSKVQPLSLSLSVTTKSLAEPSSAAGELESELSDAPVPEMGRPQEGPPLDPGALEAAYRAYPRKEGKKRGLEALEAEIRASADPVAHLARFERAVRHYANLCRDENRDPTKIKHFHTFVSNWTDYEPEVERPRPPAPGPGPGPVISQEEQAEVRAMGKELILRVLRGQKGET